MIRLAQKSDLDRVLQITRLCAREMESRKVFQWNEHYPDRQSFVNDINNSELYVYCIQDMVIGCVSICAFMDEVYSKVSWKTDGKILYIFTAWQLTLSIKNKVLVAS